MPSAMDMWIALKSSDLTDQYNTKLTPEQEDKFRKWRNKLPKNLQDTSTYDLRGAFLEDLHASANGHLTDKWKKPNHPTFSSESVYHGVDGHKGGQWTQTSRPPVETWRFDASQTNAMFHSEEGIKSYLRSDPSVQLVYPHQNPLDQITSKYMP